MLRREERRFGNEILKGREVEEDQDNMEAYCGHRVCGWLDVVRVMARNSQVERLCVP